jgi:hypothetical protein
MNNNSMFTTDRMTHLKIVLVSLMCAAVVAGIGIAARVTDGTTVSSRFEAKRDQGGSTAYRVDRQHRGS